MPVFAIANMNVPQPFIVNTTFEMRDEHTHGFFVSNDQQRLIGLRGQPVDKAQHPQLMIQQ